MTKTNNALSEALGVEYIPSEEVKQEILVPVKEELPSNTDAEEDFELTRKTMKKMLEKGTNAVDELFELAKASEHPRTFEVLANLIKTTSDVSKDLYNLQKMKKELKDEPQKKPHDGGVTVERAVFVGTTSDLLKKIKAEKQ